MPRPRPMNVARENDQKLIDMLNRIMTNFQEQNQASVLKHARRGGDPALLRALTGQPQGDPGGGGGGGGYGGQMQQQPQQQQQPQGNPLMQLLQMLQGR